MVIHKPPLGNQIALLVLLHWGQRNFMFLTSSVPDYKVEAEARPSWAHLAPKAMER